MSILNKYNRTNLFTHKEEGEPDYRTLHELYSEFGEENHVINALYINKKSKFGNAPIVASRGFLVNLPKHLLETVEDMLLDDELIALINDGKIGFNIYGYQQQGKKDTYYSVNWVEI